MVFKNKIKTEIEKLVAGIETVGNPAKNTNTIGTYKIVFNIFFSYPIIKLIQKRFKVDII